MIEEAKLNATKWSPKPDVVEEKIENLDAAVVSYFFDLRVFSSFV